MGRLSPNGRFNRLHDELEELFGTAATTPAMKFLSQRILDDVLDLQGDFLELEKVAGNAPNLKYELDVVKKERDELRARMNKLLSGQLRDQAAFGKLNEYERSQLEGAGKMDEFLLHVSEKQYINAIKLYRGIFGSGLKEAKDRVEQIMGGFR